MSQALARTRLTIRHGPFVGPVLSRVVGIHAARAPLPVDRLQDALLVADSIAAHAPAFTPSDSLPVALRAGDGRLELRVGPLRSGGGARMLESAGVGGIMDKLADTIDVRRGSGGAEYVIVTLADGRPPA